MSEPEAFATRRARALWLIGPRQLEIREVAVRDPEPHEVVVRALYGAISRGTEALVYSGRVPESEYARMRCPHQEGEFPYPVKYGYISVGEITAGARSHCGRRVFCLYPHQTQYVVPATSVVPLPEGLPVERAVLAANMETAINALWDARLAIGDRVTIIGAGVLGSLCAYLAARHGFIDVQLVDVRNDRAHVASALGLEFCSPDRAAADRDLVLHASGSEAGLCAALELCGPEGRVIELSWFGDATINLPLGRAFHANRLDLRASQVGKLSPNARPRWTVQSRLALALELCRDPVLDVLIDGEVPFEALPATFAELVSPESHVLCRRIKYA